MDSITAVIVTHNRPDTLERSLASIREQTHAVDHILVVDNAADLTTRAIVQQYNATYVPSVVNLGGAGGFAYGILTALAMGATWIWLADDDGYAADKTTVEILLAQAHKYNLGEVSPLVVDAKDLNRLAFPLRQGLTWHRLREEIVPPNGELLPNIASLFNGALFKAETIRDIGVPDLRYFIRGDEVEMHRRLRRSGIPFGTTILAAYAHPSGAAEFLPILKGKAHAQYPDNAIKRFYTYRNRGLLLSQPAMSKLRLQEWVRFTWFYLITRHDVRGWLRWRRLYSLGRKEKFNHNFYDSEHLKRYGS